jgi:hypothetical protein
MTQILMTDDALTGRRFEVEDTGGAAIPTTAVPATAPNIGFTPSTPGNWNPVPTTTQGALDQLGGRASLPVYAMFYADVVPMSTAPGVAVSFPKTGAHAGGITRGPGGGGFCDFVVPVDGDYQISWQVSDVTGASELQLVTGGSGAYLPIPGTTVTHDVGQTQLVGNVIVSLGAGQIVSVRNPSGNANTIVQKVADGTATVQASETLVIRKVS